MGGIFFFISLMFDFMKVTFESVDFAMNLRWFLDGSELWILMSGNRLFGMIFEKGIDFGEHMNSLVGMNGTHGLSADKLVFAVIDIILNERIFYVRVWYLIFLRHPEVNERIWPRIRWGGTKPQYFIGWKIIV